jgi:hypothetical protein
VGVAVEEGVEPDPGSQGLLGVVSCRCEALIVVAEEGQRQQLLRLKRRHDDVSKAQRHVRC